MDEHKEKKGKIRTGDWITKLQVWRCLAKSPENLSAVRREIDLHAGEKEYPETVPDWSTIKKIRDELAKIPPELVPEATTRSKSLCIPIKSTVKTTSRTTKSRW